MNKIYKIYLISDSTGETLDRIFLAIKAQFSSFECKTINFSFNRTKISQFLGLAACDIETNKNQEYTKSWSGSVDAGSCVFINFLMVLSPLPN